MRKIHQPSEKETWGQHIAALVRDYCAARELYYSSDNHLPRDYRREKTLEAENGKLREELKQRDRTIEELRRKIEELEERLNAMLQSGAKHS